MGVGVSDVCEMDGCLQAVSRPAKGPMKTMNLEGDGRGVRMRTPRVALASPLGTGSDHLRRGRLYRQLSLTRSRIQKARRACSRYHRRHQMAQAQGSWIAARTAPFPASNEGVLVPARIA